MKGVKLRVWTGWAALKPWTFGRDPTMLDNLLTPTHLIVVLVIALLIFGPRKLPELGKGLGEGFRGFKEGIKGTPEAPKPETPAAKTEVTEVK